jgi:acyl-CoA synthetase (AMP-forming)/AMP-acid ligase II
VFVIANLALGVTSVLPNWHISRPDRARAGQIAEHVAQHSVTRLLVQPSIAEIIATADAALPIHTLFTGGGPVFPDLLEHLSTRLPGTRIVSVYGSTEAEPIAHQALADISPTQWTAMTTGAGLLAGRPSSGTQLRIIDDEIVVTGRHVNRGYLNGVGDADNKLHLDGQIWHRTGDAGRLDPDGFLWLRGRLSARAQTLYPFEAEIAARSWPGVRDRPRQH